MVVFYDVLVFVILYVIGWNVIVGWDVKFCGVCEVLV